MKYNVALSVLVVLGALALGGSYLKTSRDRQAALTLRANVSALNLQQLAISRRECDPGQLVTHSAAYCAEIARALDAMPLQAVDMRVRPPLIPERISPPPATLRKVTIVTPSVPKPVSPAVPPEVFRITAHSLTD
jgi:hypothetical protein